MKEFFLQKPSEIFESAKTSQFLKLASESTAQKTLRPLAKGNLGFEAKLSDDNLKIS